MEAVYLKQDNIASTIGRMDLIVSLLAMGVLVLAYSRRRLL